MLLIQSKPGFIALVIPNPDRLDEHYTTVRVGTLSLATTGTQTLAIRALSKPGQGVMNLRQVKLLPQRCLPIHPVLP